ncbi:hypothetical protein VMCG_10901 [Cytospora schulzeri]|uniref:Heterokaryon incompatibility domain-containing protein n=1 Tax=Cytospora schulzeri TaxID=448051 RepID=A0A423V8G8_9PEZI|nr:hypothetical protein VMCG_10901 [Valsa malicola]
MSPSNQHRESSLDHAAPARTYFISFEFPLLPTNTPYDNHADGFWDFPERAGWILDGRQEHRKFDVDLTEALKPVLVELNNKNYRCRDRTIPESVVEARPNDALSIKCFKKDGTWASMSEEVAFLQAWLFFGVLAELSIITSVSTPDFGTESAPAILSTAALNALVCSWVTEIEALGSVDERQEKLGKMLEVIQHVVSLQTCISTVRFHIKEPQRLTYDECKALLAIRLLFRAVILALDLSSGPGPKPDLQLVMNPALAESFPADWDELKAYAIEEMLDTGWCKSECTLLEPYDGVYNFFSARLTAGRWRMDHRAHGLGNAQENALPRCQVERLATYISGLQVAGECPGLALWMDTLCIPVHPELKSYRKKAIKLMSQTYRDADVVLVLDRELQRLDMNNVSPLEQDLITAFVGWTRRLWTLQEAALAHRLYVQTLQSSYKLDRTVSEEADADEHDLAAQICFRKDIAALTSRRIPPMAMLKQSVFEQVSPPLPGFPMTITTTAFQRLAHAVKHRTTSKMEDEALILAITLELDIDPILDAPDVETRMAALLVLLKDVPADIIFGNWAKLTHAPFRWVPRSLLGFPLQALRSFGPAAICDSRGLHATYEGFLIDHGTREITQGHVFVVDKASEMKYQFETRDGGTMVPFPQTCALIFGANGSDIAVACILCRRGNEDEEHVIEVVVIGYLVMVGSGVGLDVQQPVLSGALTSRDQRWCIT